jgi:hypothetical protein
MVVRIRHLLLERLGVAGLFKAPHGASAVRII